MAKIIFSSRQNSIFLLKESPKKKLPETQKVKIGESKLVSKSWNPGKSQNQYHNILRRGICCSIPPSPCRWLFSSSSRARVHPLTRSFFALSFKLSRALSLSFPLFLLFLFFFFLFLVLGIGGTGRKREWNFTSICSNESVSEGARRGEEAVDTSQAPNHDIRVSFRLRHNCGECGGACTACRCVPCAWSLTLLLLLLQALVQTQRRTPCLYPCAQDNRIRVLWFFALLAHHHRRCRFSLYRCGVQPVELWESILFSSSQT